GIRPDVAAPRRCGAGSLSSSSDRVTACGEIRRDHARTFLRTAGPARGEPISLLSRVGAAAPTASAPSAVDAAPGTRVRRARPDRNTPRRGRAPTLHGDIEMSHRTNRNAPAAESTARTRRERHEMRTEARLRNALGPSPRRSGPRRSWKRTLQEILWAHND